jgi:lysozyme family protein
MKERIDRIIVAEGGDKYTNDPKDKGGPTRYGITEVTARAFGYNGDMRELPYDTVAIIYEKRYWCAPKFDQLPTELALVCFDWGVNAGPSVPSKALQRCLNVLNNDGAQYPDIVADGVFGNFSLYSLKQFSLKRGDEGLRILKQMMISLRSVFYIELAERKTSQEKFEYGWQKRTFLEDF